MDRLSAGHAGQRPDIRGFVRDTLPGQDRTHPLGVSVCPVSVLSPRVDLGKYGGRRSGWCCCERQDHEAART